jgi:hypothetical protein
MADNGPASVNQHFSARQSTLTVGSIQSGLGRSTSKRLCRSAVALRALGCTAREAANPNPNYGALMGKQ